MKQLESRSVTIGENTFYIRPLPAFKAANMSGELVALAAPLLSGLAPLLSKAAPGDAGTSVLDVDMKEAAPSITAAFSTLSGDKLELLLKHLLITGRNVSVEMPNEKVQLLTEDIANEVFCEDVQDMFILAYRVIQTNYSGFFKKLGNLFGPAADALAQMVTPRSGNMENLT